MGKELKLALMYRDMWQSSGKYMPRADQLEKVAAPIIDMGCFARVETNGGGFEQINLLFGENPNHSVRRWTKAFNQAGIQTQMLERGLNGLSMRPLPLDVRKLLFKVKKLQGTDISRSFDGLNNPQNLEKSFVFAKEGGMIAQAALSITHSPLHTVEYYIQLADQFIELGAQEIAIKDMAGVGRPVSIGRIVKGVRERHPNIIIQFHSHTTPGFSVTSALEAARNGADIIDVGMEPLSWGTGHPDLLTIHAMFKDAGFLLPDINKKAYMEVRTLTQSFIDDFLGYYINPNNRKMNSLLIGPGLPGGMMGSLMADLENNLKSLNKWLEKRSLPPQTEDELLLKLFEEVEYAWPKLGYPPLVTPFSQYVKNVSLVNAINLIKGKKRWEMIDENTWGMILGRSGQLLGPVGEELKELAAAQNKDFFKGNPQDLYPDQLPFYVEKMKELGWERGPDDEELLEYAMHPEQYERFKSGQAKEEFLKDLEQKRQPPTKTSGSTTEVDRPTSLTIEIDGVSYDVKVTYGDSEKTSTLSSNAPLKEQIKSQANILAPLEGKFYLTKDPGEKSIQVGDEIAEGDSIGYIESMKVMNAITADKAGKITAIVAKHGEEVEEDDILVNLN
ncbi:MAG: hypothetical protein RLZZ248_939 [Bacteroidota bacterium]|jgi:pyruvate carboxylase subunit B